MEVTFGRPDCTEVVLVCDARAFEQEAVLVPSIRARVVPFITRKIQQTEVEGTLRFEPHDRVCIGGHFDEDDSNLLEGLDYGGLVKQFRIVRSRQVNGTRGRDDRKHEVALRRVRSCETEIGRGWSFPGRGRQAVRYDQDTK